MFCSVAPISLSQTTCLPVARLTSERLVILFTYAAERERKRKKIERESTREWERRGLGRGNCLIDLLCAKPGKH